MHESSAGRRQLAVAIVAPFLILQIACAKGDRAERGAETTAAQPGTSAPPSATPASGAGEPSTDAQSIALGQSIFRGEAAGGTCTTCHGPDGKGTQLAPDLTDAQWLNADGTYASIVATITTGVSKPKQYPGVMPPMGGAQLTPEQVRAVAAYVYSLSRRS